MQENLLINIHRIFVKIRSDICDEFNMELLEIVREILVDKKSNADMIQLIIQREMNLPDVFRLEENDDLGRTLSHTEEEIFVSVFTYSVNMAIEFFSSKRNDAAYDIVDGMHAFPEIIPGVNKKSLKEYWKTHIEPIRKKWNSHLFEEVKYLFN